MRAGVHVVDEVEGGGVGLFRRPLVSERKAVNSVWVEERRSGVRGTWSAGGDMRLGVAEHALPLSRTGAVEVAVGAANREDYESGARASSLSWALGGEGAGLLAPICVRGEDEEGRRCAGRREAIRGGREACWWRARRVSESHGLVI